MTVEKKIKLMDKLLENTQYQLIDFISTKEFNKKALEENPQSHDKIVPLILTIESDIRQTILFIDFIENAIKELEKKEPNEVLIILEDKTNEKT